MPSWKATACVTTITILPPLAYGTLTWLFKTSILGVSFPWTLVASLAYIWLLSSYTWPFFTNPLRSLPVPPSSSFVLGNVILGPVRQAFLEWTKQVPNNGIIAFSGFFHHGINLLVTTPDAVKEVINDRAYDYIKPPPTSHFMRMVIGDGLVVAEGSEHKAQRKAVAPVFHGSYIRNLLPLFWNKSLHLTEVIRQRLSEGDVSELQTRRGGVVEINYLAARTTLDIIGLGCVGRDWNTLETDDNQLAKDFSALFDPSNMHVVYCFLGIMILGKRMARVILYKAHQAISSTATSLRLSCQKLIAEKKELLGYKSDTHPDILSILLQSAISFSDEELTDQLLTFLAAGHETTSSAFTWVCYLLSTHKEAQDRLRNELREHFCNGTDPHSFDRLDLEALTTLPFLNAVCNETLRLFPPAPVFARTTARPTSIQGVPIPAGIHVNICPWAMNRLLALWGEDAEDFVPDRWMGEACAHTGGAGTFSFLTFSHGPRSCIGQEFARTELKCLIAALLLQFEIELADKDYVPVPDGIVTIKPRDGLPMYLREL